jgi:ferredoxin-NADP reductase
MEMLKMEILMVLANINLQMGRYLKEILSMEFSQAILKFILLIQMTSTEEMQKMELKLEKELWNMKMAVFMTAIGKMIYSMGMDNTNFQMEKFMMVKSIKIVLKVKDK